ncbi:MAG: hypothetical protein QM564_08110 [Bergeyella sp.]
MDYATKNHFGKNNHSQRAKTKRTAPTVSRIFRVDETPERHERNTERQTEIRAYEPSSNGFLKCRFLPKLKENYWQEQTQEKAEKTEKDFYKSLSRLAEHYEINPMNTANFEFPYNIALALDDVQNRLKNKAENWQEIRLTEDENSTYFTSEERYNTGRTLYYIPILPLYRLSKNPKRKKSAELLKSVCSYLYHIAEIPYYREQSSYLSWMYEMLTDFVLSDEENEDTDICLSEMKQAEQIGDFMEKKIKNPHNLSRFKGRLKGFKAKDNFENDCFLLASKIFLLYRQYPNTTIFRNSRNNSEPYCYESEMVLSMDKYISFCSEAKGVLFQMLFETINAELNECVTMEEPIIIKKFDGSDITDCNLDFENRLFPLIEELIYILNGE